MIQCIENRAIEIYKHLCGLIMCVESIYVEMDIYVYVFDICTCLMVGCMSKHLVACGYKMENYESNSNSIFDHFSLAKI